MKNRLTKREIRGLGLLFFTLMVYSYINLFLTPVNHKADALKQSILKYKHMKNPKQQQAPQIAQKNQSMESLLEELPYMEKNSDIAYNIKIIAEKAKVALDTLEIGETATFKSSPSIKYVPLALGFTGTLKNAIKLLGLLENQNRICEINNASIIIFNSDSDSDSSNNSSKYSGEGEDNDTTNTGAEANVNSDNQGDDNGNSNSNGDTNTKLNVTIRYFFTGVD